jgi:hypothetical protein
MKKLSLLLGFSFFGLLIGIITGITSAEITNTIITVLFAFIGGKIFIESVDKNVAIQARIGAILIGFSIFCIIGILAGIYLKVNQTLTGKEKTVHTTDAVISKPPESNYLRSGELDIIKARYKSGEISCETALELIFEK